MNMMKQIQRAAQHICFYFSYTKTHGFIHTSKNLPEIPSPTQNNNSKHTQTHSLFKCFREASFAQVNEMVWARHVGWLDTHFEFVIILQPTAPLLEVAVAKPANHDSQNIR